VFGGHATMNPNEQSRAESFRRACPLVADDQ